MSEDFYNLFSASSQNGREVMRAQTMPDAWAKLIGFKIDGNKFSFEGREYQRDIIRDHTTQRVIRKSAQMGLTVISLATALFWWSQWRWNVMYLLPVKHGTTAFSQGRVQPIIDGSPMLSSLVDRVDNINHKKTPHANFYVRGTNIKTELREVPIDAMIWDEYDMMNMDNMSLAKTRMDASMYKWIMMLSTPTISGHGVDLEFARSDKRYWYIKCPYCNHQQTLNWDENVEVGDHWTETYCFCSKCKKRLSLEDRINASNKGQWVITDEDKSDEAHGYQINQLISPTRKMKELGKIYHHGLENPSVMRELMNSALGLPYTMDGDKLTEEILDDCVEKGLRLSGRNGNYSGQRVYVGVDVGKVLHVQACTIDPKTGKKIKRVMEIMSWPELKRFLASLHDFVCVVDHYPEQTMAEELAIQFWGRVFVCDYNYADEMLDWKYPEDRHNFGKVKANRTKIIDYTNNYYLRRLVSLPNNAREIGETLSSFDYNGFYQQMTSMTKVVAQNSMGNDLSKYVETHNRPDHWHHADVYETIATTFATPGVAPLSEQESQAYSLSEITGDDSFDDIGFEDLDVGGGFNLDELGDYGYND